MCNHAEAYSPFNDPDEQWCPRCGAIDVQPYPKRFQQPHRWLLPVNERARQAEGAITRMMAETSERPIVIVADAIADEVSDLARELCAFTQTIVSTAPRGNHRELLDSALAIAQHTLRTVGLSAEEDKLLATCTRLARRAINQRFRDDMDQTTLASLHEEASNIMRELS